jgi:serpin B
MDTVLHSLAASDVNSLDQALAGINGTFKDVNDKDATVSLRIANAPFAQKDLQFQQPYLDTLATDFGAGLRLVDFKANATAATDQINGWVKDQTEGRIPQLLDSLDPLTRLVLVNAIYMKAPWLSQFKKESTDPADFTRLDGSKVSVPMMGQLVREARYADGGNFKAVELPYLGKSLAMTIIVPDNLAEFEVGLNAQTWALTIASLRSTPVGVTMPRFKAETKSDLASTLSGMGMPAAFDDSKADFSGMTTQEKLYITKVIHQANITVDETGTEATAATAVVMGVTAIPGGNPDNFPEVHADRPFIFAIRDTNTGAILFLGRIVDPSL